MIDVTLHQYRPGLWQIGAYPLAICRSSNGKSWRLKAVSGLSAGSFRAALNWLSAHDVQGDDRFETRRGCAPSARCWRSIRCQALSSMAVRACGSACRTAPTPLDVKD